jgi:hypothetical protein
VEKNTHSLTQSKTRVSRPCIISTLMDHKVVCPMPV